MMNVEYRCPECSSRLFAPPGGTKKKCPHHPEVIYVQVEGYSGSDFLYIDDKGNTISKDTVGRENTRKPSSIVTEVREPDPDPEVELIAYRTMYENLTGEQVDKRWNAATIQEQLKERMSGGTNPAGEGNDQKEEVELEQEYSTNEPDEPEAPGEVVDEIPDGNEEDDEDV